MLKYARTRFPGPSFFCWGFSFTSGRPSPRIDDRATFWAQIAILGVVTYQLAPPPFLHLKHFLFEAVQH